MSAILQRSDMLTDKQTKEMAFYITNEMESEGVLSQDINIIAIDGIVRQLIREFFKKMEQPKIDRFQSKKVHWKRVDGTPWCHTSAKNPRLTEIPEMVSCRRCMPEARSQGPLPQKAPCADKKS